jgi:hypothetical protein
MGLWLSAVTNAYLTLVDFVKPAVLAESAGELFIWLHNRHDEEPGRWRIFAMSAADPRLASTQAFSLVAIDVAYDW